MFDLLSEPRISLTDLAKREGVHNSTVWRWCLRGCREQRLESFVIGRKRYTTLPAWERWIAKLNGTVPTPSETSPELERAIREAERQLDEFFGNQ